MNQRWTVLGETFEAEEDHPEMAVHLEPMAFGDFYWWPFMGTWVGSREAIETMVELSPQRQLEIAKKLRRFRQEHPGSGHMVKGVVQHNARRPNPTARVRKHNVADLQERARRLVIQISTAIQDGGDPSDGQMRQFTTQYAELQGELNEAQEMLASVEDDLKIGRAIIFDYSDPRSIHAASG